MEEETRSFMCKLFLLCSAFVLSSTAASDHRWSSLRREYGVKPTLASPFFTVKNKVFSLDDHSLKVNSTSEERGRDRMGDYTAVVQVLVADDTKIQVVTKAYDSVEAVVFEVHFLDEVQVGDYSNKDSVSTGFPCFVVNDNSPYGFLSFGGSMLGSEDLKTGMWSLSDVPSGGMGGGPVAVFDKNNSVVVFSALSEFMITSPYFYKEKSCFCHGVMATVPTIPKMYSYASVLYNGSSGINEAFSGWGEFIRDFHERTTEYRDSDLILNYLGYWTDGGAYYFYNTEPMMTYQDTILAVRENARKLEVPYKYLQLDSWWYFKDNTSHNDVTRWEPMPSVFPDGMRFIWDSTEWPLACHNRQWSHQTPYAKQNGGKFNFIVEHENEIALPQDQVFWEYLFREARHWGLTMYEQDHLNQQTDSCAAITRDVHVGRDWLIQMGQAARQHAITLQYCMDYPRHALQSLEIPVVTHARVSGDYRGGSDQWQIGLSSIFAHALGIAPFKDCFWSTDKYQPGNTYNLSETHPELEIAVATLSTGPVAPADKVGYTNVSSLLRCCNADGLILKPSKPAVAIDDQILRMAYKGSEGPDGQVWSTYSRIGEWHFGIILAADIKNTYPITPLKAGFRGESFGKDMKIYNFEAGTRKVMQDFSNEKPLEINTECSKKAFCLYYTSPVIQFNNSEVVITGEISKIVPLSPKRVRNIAVTTGGDIYVTLEGAIGERVDFSLVVDNKVLLYRCVMSQLGEAVLEATSGGDCALTSVAKDQDGGTSKTDPRVDRYQDNTLKFHPHKSVSGSKTSQGNL